MMKVILTDTHFGWKQNSVTWLDAQMRFLDLQVIPYLRRHKDDGIRLIHLGDVFDSRSSISPMIAKAVRERFIEMRKLVKDFYIVAGNHDFYSPNSDDIDSLTMVLRDLDINLVIKESVYDGEDAFIPWYVYKDTEWLPDGVKNVYTHADIFGEDRKMLSGVNIYSGHIHMPMFDPVNRLNNLGSCYSLNFTDANQERYFYVEDENGFHQIPNEHSISFWRLKNEEIFDIELHADDYYELYIDQTNMQCERYQKRLTDMRKQIKNLWVIPQLVTHIDENETFDSYNIDEICKSIIPNHLKDKFKQIEQYLKTEQE